jgi:hypothetical protein
MPRIRPLVGYVQANSDVLAPNHYLVPFAIAFAISFGSTNLIPALVKVRFVALEFIVCGLVRCPWLRGECEDGRQFACATWLHKAVEYQRISSGGKWRGN